jgi:hypothetical protein
MIKYLMTPFGGWFLMLVWAATFGESVSYFTPGKNMLDEYLIVCQIWFFVCIVLDLKKKTYTNEDKEDK